MIRAFQFLRQFRFEIKYKFDKEHIILNVLLYLISQKPYAIVFKNYSEFNTLYVNYSYSFTQMQMNNTFRNHLIKIYINDDK